MTEWFCGKITDQRGTAQLERTKYKGNTVDRKPHDDNFNTVDRKPHDDNFNTVDRKPHDDNFNPMPH